MYIMYFIPVKQFEIRKNTLTTKQFICNYMIECSRLKFIIFITFYRPYTMV